MKITLDTHVLSQLNESYGDKAPQVLWDAIDFAMKKAEENPLEGVRNPLDYEEIVRHHKISQRLSVAVMESARDCLGHLNREAGKAFKPVPGNLKPIALLIRNYDKATVLRVIDNKVAKWKGTSMDDYLRPATLFRPSNFESYANESLATEVQDKNFSAELDSMLGAK